MTLLLMLLDRQTCLLQKSDLTVDQLVVAIQAGDLSFSELGNLWLNELPRCVTALDGLVVVSAASPTRALPETIPPPLEVDFSPRQTQVLRLLMDGLTAKEISIRLQISKRTTDEHIREIKKKLEAKTIAQTVGKAVALGYWARKR